MSPGFCFIAHKSVGSRNRSRVGRANDGAWFRALSKRPSTVWDVRVIALPSNRCARFYGAVRGVTRPVLALAKMSLLEEL